MSVASVHPNPKSQHKIPSSSPESNGVQDFSAPFFVFKLLEGEELPYRNHLAQEREKQRTENVLSMAMDIMKLTQGEQAPKQ